MDWSSIHNIHDAETHPLLFKTLASPSHPLNTIWPRFLDHDLLQDLFCNTCLDHAFLQKFQFAVTENQGTAEDPPIIATCRSIPFHWPELEFSNNNDDEPGIIPEILQSLPAGGWDNIVARGLAQCCTREGRAIPEALQDLLPAHEKSPNPFPESPNTLCALFITIIPDRRNMGIAERLIGAMKQAARAEGLKTLVVPLRPTKKADFPFVAMEEYLTWKTPPDKSTGRQLPFDPWLRKHVRLGGKIVKITPESQVVRGSVEQWEEWTGVDFRRQVAEVAQQEEEEEEEEERERREQGERSMGEERFVEIAIKGGLVPVKVNVKDKTGVYKEPNVWAWHEL